MYIYRAHVAPVAAPLKAYADGVAWASVGLAVQVNALGLFFHVFLPCVAVFLVSFVLAD